MVEKVRATCSCGLDLHKVQKESYIASSVLRSLGCLDVKGSLKIITQHLGWTLTR